MNLQNNIVLLSKSDEHEPIQHISDLDWIKQEPETNNITVQQN